MARYTKEDIFRIVDEEDVAFIRLQFCDIFGTPKNMAITARQLDKALNNEIVFDSSSVEGLTRSEESDMYLYPDIDTFEIYPWRPQSGKVARMYCDIYTLDRKPFVGDPRYLLKKVLKEGEEMGLRFQVQPELEFFLLEYGDDGKPSTQIQETASYLDVAPADLGENVRRDIILNLEELDFEVTSSLHESAPAQHEIDFAEVPAGKAADMIMTFRMAVKTIAKKHGLYATFMPKPLEGIHGSGMHLNFLAEDLEGFNVFYDKQDPQGLSATAYHFIAGILTHASAITLVTNPMVNSYKRLVRGYDAPVNISWSGRSANRSSLIRIPSLRGQDTRVEVRNPDSTGNPYLILALTLAAGMDGIRRNLTVPEELPAQLPEEQQDERFQMLPETLGNAIEIFKKDAFVKSVLGEQVFKKFAKAKEKEWNRFRTCVTQWELKEYLGKY